MSDIAKRKPPDHGTHIDAKVHQLGYELWRSGLQEVRCRRKLDMTIAQWKWLKTEGDGRLPSYESMLIDEVKQIRTEARHGALELSRQGVEAIKLRAKNARAANALVHGIFLQIATDLKEGGNGEGWVPSKSVIETLKILEKFADLNSAAEAFSKIYGDVAMHKALYPERDAPRPNEASGAPLIALQGDTADREAFLSDDAMSEVIDELRSMSPDELQEFADGGDEAVPVITHQH